MNLSVYSRTSHRSMRSGRSDLLSISALSVAVKPVLQLGTTLLEGKIKVIKLLSERAFIVRYEELGQDEQFVLKYVQPEDTVKEWIDVPTHINIVTAYDEITHFDKRFVLMEMSNYGDVAKYVSSLNYNFAKQIPKRYVQMIFDFFIQIATGLEFAHKYGLVHGGLDLSCIVTEVVQSHAASQTSQATEQLIFKIKDFKPAATKNLTLATDKSNFITGNSLSKLERRLNLTEKIQLLKLKDLYSLGVCVLELMIGKFVGSRDSISLSSIPGAWADMPESTPLISALAECMNMENMMKHQNKLGKIKKMMTREYKHMFKKTYHFTENVAILDKADVFNKKAIFAELRNLYSLSEELWTLAIRTNQYHLDSIVNFSIHNWIVAKFTDEQLLEQLKKLKEIDSRAVLTEGMICIALGFITRGRKLLESVVGPEGKETDSSKIDEIIQEDEEEEEVKIQISPGKKKNVDSLLDQNREFHKECARVLKDLSKTDQFENHTTKVLEWHQKDIEQLAISGNSAFIATSSSDAVNIWSLANNILNHMQTLKLEDIQPFDQSNNSPSKKETSPLSDQEEKQSQDDQVIMTEEKPEKINTAPLLAISNTSEIVVLHYPQRLNILFIHSLSSSTTTEIPLCAQGSSALQNNQILEIGFISQQVVRCTLLDTDLSMRWCLDVNLQNCQISERKMETNFLDDHKSIFKYGKQYERYFPSLINFLNKNEGKVIKFPQKNTDVLVGFDPDNAQFFVYDIFSDKIIRVFRALQSREVAGIGVSASLSGKPIDCPFLKIIAEGKNLFAIHTTADYILIANGRAITMKRLLLSKLFSRYVRPCYYTDQNRLIYSIDAKISFRKQLAKVINDVRNQFSPIEELIPVLVKGFKDRSLIQQNQEFLRAYKTVMASKGTVVIQNIVNKKAPKLEKFHSSTAMKLQDVSEMSRVKVLGFSNIPEKHHIYVYLEDSVYKYDLITKDLLLKFKLPSAKLLTHRGEQLLVSDGKNLMLYQEQKQNVQLNVTVQLEEQEITAMGCRDQTILVAGDQCLSLYIGTKQTWSCKMSQHKGLKKIKRIHFEGEWIITGSSSGYIHIWGRKGEDQLKMAGAYKCPVDNKSIDHIAVLSRYDSGSFSHPEFDIVLCEQKCKEIMQWYATTLDFKVVKIDPEQSQTQYTCLQIEAEPSKQIFLAAFSPGLVQFWSSRHLFVISMVKFPTKLFEIDSFCTVAATMTRGAGSLDIYLVKWDLEDKSQKPTTASSVASTPRTTSNPSLGKLGKRKKGRNQGESSCCFVF